MDASGHSATILPAHAVVGGEEDSTIGNISALSVVSLMLGLAAPLSLMAPLLWAIPLAGAAIAMVAMRRIAASDGALIGRRAAVIGLALSVASVCAAASHSIVTQQVLSHQARSTALEWFTLLEAGDVASAYQYTVESMRGPEPPPPPGSPPPTEPPRDPQADFRDTPLVQYVVSLGPDAQTRFDQELDFTAAPNGDFSSKQQFLVIPAAGSVSSAVVVHVTMVWSLPSRMGYNKWLVSDYGSDNLPARSAGDK
jgi:hypothetical protein